MTSASPSPANTALICLLAVCAVVSTPACNKSRSGIVDGAVIAETSSPGDTSDDGVTVDVLADAPTESDVRVPSPEGCEGNTPFCVDACLDDFFQPSVCLVDTWACPPGTQPVDNCPSAAAPCTVVSTSEIPGVRIEILLDDCRVSRADALESGVILPYRVVFEDTLELTLAGFDEAPCVRPDDDGLQMLATLGGSGVQFCECDQGLCASPEAELVTLQAGSYENSLVWPGRAWNGPSDFGAPLGEPFPFGTYVFEIRVPYLDGDGVLRPVEARAAAVIQVVP